MPPKAGCHALRCWLAAIIPTNACNWSRRVRHWVKPINVPPLCCLDKTNAKPPLGQIVAINRHSVVDESTRPNSRPRHFLRPKGWPQSSLASHRPTPNETAPCRAALPKPSITSTRILPRHWPTRWRLFRQCWTSRAF